MEERGDPLQHPLVDLLLNQLNSSVVLLNPAGEVLYLNPSAERLLGVSLQTAKEKDLGTLFRLSDPTLDLTSEVVDSGRTLKAHEIQVDSPHGPQWIQMEIAPVGSPEHLSGILILMEELSMAQALQEENRVLDRLSMMGTLASGLAHEIRNPLGGIRAAAEMLLREETREENKEYLSMILSEVDRLNQLLSQLLDFAKPRRLKKESLNINQILAELLALQESTIARQGICLKQEFDPSLPPVEGHKGSLKQAFLNLIKNALEAMEKGGTLKVATGFKSDYRMIYGEGRIIPMAQVTISDTGPGIKPEHVKSLFTPFFTTKPKGTGLGLMMTQRILKEHDGVLRVNTEMGKGSTFKVLLKLAVP